jgi:phosphoserine aminotransferase
MLGEVLNWAKELGGLDAISERNENKAKLIYDVIDTSNGFYVGHAQADSHFLMNITFTLKTPELGKSFL